MSDQSTTSQNKDLIEFEEKRRILKETPLWIPGPMLSYIIGTGAGFLVSSAISILSGLLIPPSMKVFGKVVPKVGTIHKPWSGWGISAFFQKCANFFSSTIVKHVIAHVGGVAAMVSRSLK